MNGDAFVPVAVTERSGFAESVHRAAVVVLGADGSIVASAGDPGVVVYPRSSNKPFQATAMLELGLDLAPDELALACASHWGTARHTVVVERVLARHGLAPSDLGNTADLPLDPEASRAVIRRGGRPEPLTMNCSGKHAAMLATCVVNGWPTAGYLAPDHPLQQAVTDVIVRLSGEPVHGIGVDGCGAPAHRLSLLGLAHAIRAVALGQGIVDGRRVAEAMTAHPDLVGGETSESTRFMRAVPGLLAKEGAEGVMVAAHADGRTVAFKIADGSGRARPLVLAAALAAAGFERPVLEGLSIVPVLGHGVAVGALQPVGVVADWLPVGGGVQSD